jgi:hypothetical protein
MKSIVTATLMKRMKAGINSVLSGEKKEYNGKFITACMVDEYMKSIGWERGDMETNGWQWDWWMPYTKDGKMYTANGCGWDGKFHFEEAERDDYLTNELERY